MQVDKVPFLRTVASNMASIDQIMSQWVIEDVGTTNIVKEGFTDNDYEVEQESGYGMNNIRLWRMTLMLQVKKEFRGI